MPTIVLQSTNWSWPQPGLGGLVDRVLDVRITPGRIAGAYVALGLVLLFAFDLVLPRVMTDPLLTHIQTVKGGIEVVLSAGLIYGLSRRGRTQVRRRQERLKQQRQELAVLHRVLRHNFRNDMNVIAGHADDIQEECGRETIEARAQTIRDRVERSLSYSEKAQTIRRLADVGTTTIDLSTWVPEFVREHPLVDDSVEVRIDVEEGLAVSVNTLFSEAMEELLTASVDRNETDPAEIDITARTDPDDPRYALLKARDNGPGPVSDVIEVFQKGRPDQLMHLDDLGLWIVYWTVVESGGEFDITSEGFDGTRFRMRLPKA